MENHEARSVGVSKREKWKKHLDAQSASGLTQLAYCEQNELKIANFKYWKQRLHGKAPQRSGLRFVPIKSAACLQEATLTASSALIKVHLRGLILETPESIDPHRLARLVSALGAEGGTHVAN